ncbi:sugar transferase [Gaiella sp.]|jgi:exopolysaccharide biosynthesis polyprenyl glycosylphosphotransferase|uniref:sugar transferase n=1 Tax=Gaiella sp. TaxID=2663207 RepID=UPI002E37EF9F|nr:sugar transferase [Gaiella sp.]HEX5582482.1 sugar transferase [Gaiella sp.]
MRRLLLLADIVGLMTAFLVAEWVVSAPVTADTVLPQWEFVIFCASLPFWVLLARLYGLYDRDEERTDHSSVDDFFGMLQVVTIGTWVFLAAMLVTNLAHPTLDRLVVFWGLAVAFVSGFRVVIRVVGRRHAAYVQNVLIVGSGQVARQLAEKMGKHRSYGLNIVGFVDRDEGAIRNGGAPLELVGTTDELRHLVHQHAIDRVVIAFSTDSHEETLDVIRLLQNERVQVDIVPRMFEVLGTSTQLHTIEGIPLVGLALPRLSSSSRLLKRSFDVLGATVGLVLLSPFLLLIALVIKLDSRGPVFFRQVRMGEDERTFRIYKFRTMVADAETRKDEVAHLNMHRNGDPRMFKVPSDPRVTRVGAFLRRSRIDELPQLINVLKGEMSLVGPRPLILDEDRFVERWARRRLSLRPGITGLWQVLGASDIPFEEMTKLDYLYVTNWSLREDVRLIMRTIPSLVRGRAAF